MTLNYELSLHSVSKSSLILEVRGKSRIPVELKRHLAPRTVGMLLRSIPLDGNAHLLGGGIIYLESPIDSGLERARRDFKRGDVAFYPGGRSICFFARAVYAGKQMSPIGKIISGVEDLDNAKPGDVLSLHQDAG